MAKPILVANWKNHPSSLFEARELLKQLTRNSRVFKKWDFFIAPPFTYFELVGERAGKFAKLASQDISTLSSGSHTGKITPDIIKSFGVKLSIIGHSEKRALGETSEYVAKKIETALKAGIVPLLCIGELTHDEDGEHFKFIEDQIKTSLSLINKKSKNFKMMIAYEPVWAIGKSAKGSIQPKDLEQTLIFIKKVLSDFLGRNSANKIPILYGGAVEPANVEDLMNTGIDGLLVGHASLNAKSFKSIAESILK